MKAKNLKNILIFLILFSALVITSVDPSRSPFGVISSSSMEPTLHRGDLVLVLKVPFERVQKGDIVVFRDPNNGVAVAHRVVGRLEDGRLLTKGDNEEYLDQVRPGPVMPPIDEDLYLGLVPVVSGHPVKIPRVGAFLLNGLPFRITLVLLLALLLVPPDRSVQRSFLAPKRIFLYSLVLFFSLAVLGHMTIGRGRIGEHTYYIINNTILPLRYVVLSEGAPREMGILLPGSYVQLRSHSVDVVYSSFGWLLIPRGVILGVLSSVPQPTGIVVLDLLSSILLSGIVYFLYLAYAGVQLLLHARLSRRVLSGPHRVVLHGGDRYLVAGMVLNGVILGSLHPILSLISPLLGILVALGNRPTLASFAFSSSLFLSLGFSMGLLRPCPKNILFIAVSAALLGLVVEQLARIAKLYLIPEVGR